MDETYYRYLFHVKPEHTSQDIKNSKRTSLFYAHDIEELKKCLSNGVNINHVDIFGRTALYYYILSGKINLAVYLIAYNADTYVFSFFSESHHHRILNQLRENLILNNLINFVDHQFNYLRSFIYSGILLENTPIENDVFYALADQLRRNGFIIDHEYLMNYSRNFYLINNNSGELNYHALMLSLSMQFDLEVRIYTSRNEYDNFEGPRNATNIVSLFLDRTNNHFLSYINPPIANEIENHIPFNPIEADYEMVPGFAELNLNSYDL